MNGGADLLYVNIINIADIQGVFLGRSVVLVSGVLLM